MAASSYPPTSLEWPPIVDDRAPRARVDEQVLREGTEVDVRDDIDPDLLRDPWDDLVL